MDVSLSVCDYLELRPQAHERAKVIVLLAKLQHTPGAYQDVYSRLLGFMYEPYCTKHQSACVVMEAPVIAAAFRTSVQPLETTVLNGDQIEACSDREATSSSVSRAYDLSVFLLRHLAYLRPELERMQSVVEHPGQ